MTLILKSVEILILRRQYTIGIRHCWYCSLIFPPPGHAPRPLPCNTPPQPQEIFPQESAHLAVTRLAEAFSSAKLPVRSVFRANDHMMAVSRGVFRCCPSQKILGGISPSGVWCVTPRLGQTARRVIDPEQKTPPLKVWKRLHTGHGRILSRIFLFL